MTSHVITPPRSSPLSCFISRWPYLYTILLLDFFVHKVCVSVMSRKRVRVADFLEESSIEEERRKSNEAREQRQVNLSRVIQALVRREGRPQMPGCTPCRKVGAVCEVSRLHPNCARCVRYNTVSCDATLKPDRGLFFLFSDFFSWI